jgi:hypothetical protein
MILEGCIPFAKEVVISGESEDEEEEAQERNEALDTGLLHTSARVPEAIPAAIFKVLRFIMMLIVTMFRTYVRPYIQSNSFEPSNVKQALQRTREVLKQLEEISLNSVSEIQRIDVSAEIALIEKSVSRIEEISR